MIRDELNKKQLEYMKSRDEKRLVMLRLFLSQIKYKEIELRPQKIEMTDEMSYKVLKKLIKQKTEAVELSKQAGRQEVVDRESGDLEILKEFSAFFPAEMQV